MVDTVTINEPNNGPTLEEQAAQMGITQEVPANEAPTEKILGKFETTDDLVKAYQELEKKLGGAAPETTEGEAPGELETPTSEAETAAKEAVENAGLDWEALNTKFAENGALEDADYEALEKAGIPRSMVEDYIEGQEAKAELQVERQRQTAFSEVGGEQQYGEMVAWAAKNLTENEIAVYDNAVESGDMNVVLNAIRGLKARWQLSSSVEPERQISGKTAASETDTYKSITEMEVDMRDPRYRTDPAFRSKVEQKLGRSSIM